MSDATERDRFYEIIDGFRTAMLTTFTEGGTPHGRPMHVAGRDGDQLWFITSRSSAKVREGAGGDTAVLTFQDDGRWVAASGPAVIVDDRDRVNELWAEHMELWFPDGPADLDVVALGVTIDSGEYWAIEGTDAISFAIGAAKSMMTGQPIDADREGEHGEVR